MYSSFFALEESVATSLAGLQAHAASSRRFLQADAATRFAGACSHRREGHDQVLQGHAARAEPISQDDAARLGSSDRMKQACFRRRRAPVRRITRAPRARSPRNRTHTAPPTTYPVTQTFARRRPQNRPPPRASLRCSTRPRRPAPHCRRFTRRPLPTNSAVNSDVAARG